MRATRCARALQGALLFSSLAACGGADQAPLSAVLITLDTTNRDALGCYGQALPLTPHLDRIAAEGLVFEQARSVAPLTLPAHISMLTGLVPLRHSVRDNALLPVAGSAETLAERLARAGYQTAAFLSAVVLAAPYGLDQGFDVYDAPQVRQNRGPTAHILERPAAESVRAAIDWLRGRDRARPFFLWVHGYDPHGPYDPPAEFLARAGGDPYLGEVAALDHAVGELLAALQAEHGLERLVLVVAADHGEGLGDHGERTHAVLCYERMMRIPLLVRLPDGARAGERVTAPASLVDVAPTVLDALGLAPLPGIDGLSLLDPALAERGGTYFESYHGFLNYGWSPLAGWFDGTTKFLHGTDPELYDLTRDPAESVNLHGQRDEAVAAARARIEALAALPRLEAGASSVDEDLAASVQALGYAGAAGADSDYPEPLEDTGLPAPRARIVELELFYRAVLRYNNGKVAEAIAELEALVAQNPRNAEALNVLAAYLYEQKEYTRALEVLRSIPAGAQDRTSVQDLLGHCQEHLGEPAKALEHFERALALKPGDPHQTKDVERLRAKVGN
ncbi:MAG TPA: sulfatase-like hydrolase/transferase [Planctomycetota bacterium]